MKRSIAFAVLLTLAALPLAAEARASRDELAALEKQFDSRIWAYNINDPFDLLGTTRGVCLEGYGVVFTAELNLVAGAVITPFRSTFSPEQIQQLRQKKLERLEEVKSIMRTMLLESAAALREIPLSQRIAVGVTLSRFSWEDSRGLPAQILMEATRQSLLDIQLGNVSANDAIEVKEF